MPDARQRDHQQDLFDRLAGGHAAGITVVTPNRRLAQVLRAEFDSFQKDKQLPVWEEADILPLDAFVQRCYEDALYGDGGHALPLLLSDAQARELWVEAIEGSGWKDELRDVPGTAERALEAWRLAQAWRIAGARELRRHRDTRAFSDGRGPTRGAEEGRAHRPAAALRLALECASRSCSSTTLRHRAGADRDFLGRLTFLQRSRVKDPFQKKTSSLRRVTSSKQRRAGRGRARARRAASAGGAGARTAPGEVARVFARTMDQRRARRCRSTLVASRSPTIGVAFALSLLEFRCRRFLRNRERLSARPSRRRRERDGRARAPGRRAAAQGEGRISRRTDRPGAAGSGLRALLEKAFASRKQRFSHEWARRQAILAAFGIPASARPIRPNTRRAPSSRPAGGFPASLW